MNVEMTKTQGRIFHYTTLSSLAMILHNQTLRFTKLSNLNDPLEGKTADIQGAEKLIYCSSWTKNEEDTIPMWKMYTNLNGVRISVNASSLFKTTGPIQRGDFGTGEINFSKLSESIIVPAVGFVDRKRIINKIDEILGPDPVEYKSSNSEAQPKIISNVVSSRGSEYNHEVIRLAKVGLYKHEHWMYESEVRFRLAYAACFSPPVGNSAQHFCQCVGFEKDYIDVPLSSHFVDDLHITMGPLSDPAQEILLRALLEKYAPKATIDKSKIQMR